jgi:PAS domain S-box-containing protein
MVLSVLIFKPLKKLINGVSMAKEGKIDFRIGIKSNDEIGILSNSFDELMGKLADEKSDVDKKIAKQTEKLQENTDDLSGQKMALINILEDNEEVRKNIEEARVKDEAILSSIGDGVIVTDQKGNIMFVNRAATKLLNLSQIEIVGKKIVFLVEMQKENGILVDPNDHPILKVLKNKKSIIDELYYYVCNDKTKFPASVTVTPIFLNKELIGTIEVFRDITKERDIDKAKTEFVSLASHQLRTPLSSINWYAEMLLNGDAGRMTAEQSQYLQEIYRGNQRMVDLVNSLLNVSRLELGTFSVEPEECDLKDIFKDVLDDLLPKMVNKKIKLEKKFAKMPKLQLDKKLTHIILENLLSNAVKYTPNGGKVSLNIVKKDEDILITVEDNGMGIPDNQQGKVFEKLFRADNVRATDTEGTGLGLYLVKSILTHVGGTIRFQSVENKGTKFFVTFPLGGMKKKAGPKSLS